MSKHQIADPKSQAGYWVLIVAVLLVALFFRTHNLDRVPPGLDGDEMFNGWDALRVWEGHLAIYFPTNYGREPLLIYMMAVTTRLLGVGPWSMRLASVLGGMANLVFTWLLARRLFNFRVALLTMALMSISLWPVFLSRVALRAGLQPACQAIAAYALWRGLAERSSRWAVVAGLFVGLNVYTYTASRIFPLVLILWLLALFVSRSRSCASPPAPHGSRTMSGSSRQLVLAALVATLVMLPLGIFAIRHPEAFNQRLHKLDSELVRLQAGDLEPMWRSVKAALGMFTQVGDPSWRYNPAKRPVYDWATGVLFYVGLIVSLFRARRPSYSLLLVWLPVMLIPTVLSIGTPSFWRAVGALTPIYLIPPIGADFVYDHLTHWATRVSPRASRLTPLVWRAILVIGLLFVGADTWHDYFEEWPRHPRVLHTYEADLAAAARYLNGLTRQKVVDTPVWVSSEFAGDLSRRLLDLQSTYPGPVRWFVGEQVTVWPSGWAGQDVLLIYTRTSPPNLDAVAVLSDYLVYQEIDAAGRPHLWVYRILGERLSEIPWQPAHALDGQFAWDREMLGYSAPTQVRRQTRADVVVYWRVPPGVVWDADDLPFSYVCLRDRMAGRCLDEGDRQYNAYPPWDWTVGDVVAQRYSVPAPAYILPQTTYFHIGMYTSRGEISFADEDSAGVPLLVGPVEVTGSASVDPQWKEDTPTFGQELALVGFHILPTQLPPGSAMEVELRWQAMRAPTQDYVARLELRDRDAGGITVSTDELLGTDRYATSQWAMGEPVHTYSRVEIPLDLDNGEFDVYLSMLGAGSGQGVGDPLLLGSISVSGWPRNYELPEPDYPLVADFGSSIRLLGFDLKQVDPTGGGQIEVVLYWQALDTVSEDYKVFVHLYHPFIEGGLPGQHDSPPGNGAFPTSGWLPGEVVTDPHLVPIEPNADTGLSEMGVGFYLPATGERLPVFVDGQRQSDDVLIISEVTIR